MAKLTQEEIKAVESYTNDIKTLKDYVATVRKLPGMWIGKVGNDGFLTMIREAYQNAIDQVLLEKSPANWVYLYYNENSMEVRVYDNGLGLPFNDIERIITTPNTSKNYVKHKGEYSSGINGVGIKVVNALSDHLIAESYKYDGTAVRFETKDGYPIGKPKPIKNKDNKQGTHISFIPCDMMYEDKPLPWKRVYMLAKQIVSRTPIGTVVDFEGVDTTGKTHLEHIVNQDGIVSDLIEHSQYPICKPIHVFADNGDMKLEAAFVFDSGGKNGPTTTPEVIPFCNFCPTFEGGTHVDGTIDGIARWFSNYMNKVYLASNKKNKLTVSVSDIRTGLVLSVNAAMLEPVLLGQSKDYLSNKEMAPFCKQVVMDSLDQWSKENPQDLQKLCKYFKDIAELRTKEESGRAKIATKYTSNSLTGMPRKYAKPIKECKELFIVEGDSAGGSAKTARDVNTQGIFPIRGKIASAFEKSYHDFWSNAETQGIAQIILGHPYTRNFDANKDVKWEKIIFMADADVDGAHIASLLLRFFILYMPQLIQAGKVYKALPPLYGIVNGKKIRYVTDQLEFVRYVEKEFVKNNQITTYKGKLLSQKELAVLFMRNEDYVYEMERLGKTYGVDPKILEFALFNYHNKTSFSAMKKDIKKEFRFMNVEKTKKGNVLYTGTTSESNFLFMNDRIIADCSRILNIIMKNDYFYYKLNGVDASLYDIMKVFDSATPKNIKRYKGLGEMDADQLAESTMSPQNRTLIRYTLEDAKEEVETIRAFESDRSKLLDFVGTVKRTDLLD